MAKIAKILIVEDEFLVAMGLEHAIEDIGHESIGVAQDVASALVLAGHHPDVAFVDLNLRDGLTGPGIGAMLSAQGTSVIYLTANPRLLGDGVPGTLGVMTKPCNAPAVQGALDFALQHRRGEMGAPPPYVVPFTLLGDAPGVPT